MKKSTLLNPGALMAAAGVIIGTLVVAQAQQTPGTQTPRTDQPSTSQRSRATTGTESTSATGEKVMKVNKASQLIGMSVKNSQGEKLADIKDVVLDFTSGKVAYLVVDAGGGILTSEKLHAVPLQAFQAGTDGETLILNTDKDRLAKAPGFTKDNYPSPTNPSWGAEPFWDEKGASTTTPGTKYRSGATPRSGDTTRPDRPNRDQ